MDANDERNFNFIRSYIQNAQVLVDVGANNGTYTDFFLQNISKNGKVYSIELHPETFNELFKKYKGNKNVITLNKAISNINSSIKYYSGNDSYTNNIIGHDVNYRKNSEIGTIESITLDSLLLNEQSITLIKIDVEGAELLVLEGISEIINKLDFLLIECHFDEDWSQILNLLLFVYNLSCINIITNEVITENSKRPYQCFCKRKK